VKKIITTTITLCYALCVVNALAEPNQPDYAKLIPPDKLKEDLDFLFKTIEEVHPNMYAYTSKEEFNPLREQLYESIDHPMNRLDFYKLVAPVVAALKNGHTFIEPISKPFQEYLIKGGKIFPLNLYWDGERVIVHAYSGPNDLPIGTKVLTIDNQDAKEFLIKIARYFPAEGKAYNLPFLERGYILHQFLWLEKGEPDSLKLKIKASDGEAKEYNIKGVSYTELIKLQANESTKSKRTDSDEVKTDYSYRYIPDHNTGLIEFNSFNDLERFKIFLTETFKKIKEQNISSLIIDIRKNPGGNSKLGDELLKYLTDKTFIQFEKCQIKVSTQLLAQQKWIRRNHPEAKIGSIIDDNISLIQPGDKPLRFKGRTFVLMGPRSNSSSSSFASAIKHFNIGILLGQETTDTTVCYGDCIYNALPHSGLNLSVACKRFICAGGKEDERGVIPDYEVKQKTEDSAKGVDTVLQFTLNLIKTGEAEK